MSERVRLRTCVSCRSRRETAALLRIAVGPAGALQLGRSEAGRGAWVCASSPGCVAALSSANLSRALRTEVGEESAARLREELGERPI